MLPMLAVAAAVLALNLPFGFWRARQKKFTLNWFLAIHGAVPIVAALRYFSGVGWQLATLPVLIGAYCGGQFIGGRLCLLKSRNGGEAFCSSEKSFQRCLKSRLREQKDRACL